MTKHEEFAKSVVKDVLRLKAQEDELPAITDDMKAIADLIEALNRAGATIDTQAPLATVLGTTIHAVDHVQRVQRRHFTVAVDVVELEDT